MPRPEQELDRIEPRRRTHLLFGTGPDRRGYLLTFRPTGLRGCLSATGLRAALSPARRRDRLAEVDRARYAAAICGLSQGAPDAIAALHRLGFGVRRVE